MTKSEYAVFEHNRSLKKNREFFPAAKFLAVNQFDAENIQSGFHAIEDLSSVFGNRLPYIGHFYENEPMADVGEVIFRIAENSMLFKHSSNIDSK